MNREKRFKMSRRNRKLKKSVKIAIAVIIVIVLFLIVYAVLSVLTSPESDEKPHEIQLGSVNEVTVTDPLDENDKGERSPLTFALIDVGQAESIFIDYEDTEILIDGGYYVEGDTSVLDFITPYIDGNLEYVIGTHSHADHVGGLSAIYDSSIHVEKTIYGDLTDELPCKIFADKARKNSDVFENDADTTISIAEGITLTVYDICDDAENTNNNSVVCVLAYDDISFYLPGDLEAEGEVLLSDLIGECTVVVAGHHGSNTANTLLGKLRPKYILVPCARNNEYFFPHKSFLEDALRYTKDIYATYRSGTIIMTTDGISIESNLDANDRLTIEDAGATKEYERGFI